MSLLRKIRRNIQKVKRFGYSYNKPVAQVENTSRIILEALEPRVLLAADLEAMLMLCTNNDSLFPIVNIERTISTVPKNIKRPNRAPSKCFNIAFS